jgi:hypothetical protein
MSIFSKPGSNPTDIPVSSLASGTDGELITWDASGDPATVAVGTSGHVLTSNGAGAAPTFQEASGGAIVQVVKNTTTTRLEGTTTIPLDTTVPQNTEGDEILTQAITPTSSSNLLKIDVCVSATASGSGGRYGAVTLFQDSTADALAGQVKLQDTTTNPPEGYFFTYYMTAGTTSSTTFKIRGGCTAAGTFVVNSSGPSVNLWNGQVEVTSITITEIAV